MGCENISIDIKTTGILGDRSAEISTNVPLFYSLTPRARERFIQDLVNEPTERKIIDIVRNTIAPNVVTPLHLLDSYKSLNILQYMDIVYGGTSGRSERRTLNRYEPIYWELPGQGEIGNPGECDRIHGTEACLDSKKGRKIALSVKRWFCDRATCPQCFEHWTVTHAKDCMNKIRAGRQLFSFYGARYELCHIVISAPPEYADYMGVRKGYDLVMEDFYRIADGFDMHGYMVLHMWRGKKDNDSDITLYVPSEDAEEDGEFWKKGPHVHAVAFCDPQRIISLADSLYKATGFVIKVVAQDMEDQYAENVLSYALSHCGIGHWEGHKDLKTIHPFGYLATSKENGITKLAEVREEAVKTCSECGGFIYDTNELDLRVAEEDMQPSTVPLYHQIYVRRNERAGHLIFTDGMTDAEILEYARQRTYDVAIIYDDRPTVIDARCDVDRANLDEMQKPMYWRRPPNGFRGIARITPFDDDHHRRFLDV